MKTYDSITKYCPACDDFHELSEFGVDRRRGDGLTVYCKQVYRDRQKHYRQQPTTTPSTPREVLPLRGVDPTVEDC